MTTAATYYRICNEGKVPIVIIAENVNHGVNKNARILHAVGRVLHESEEEHAARLRDGTSKPICIVSGSDGDLRTFAENLHSFDLELEMQFKVFSSRVHENVDRKSLFILVSKQERSSVNIRYDKLQEADLFELVNILEPGKKSVHTQTVYTEEFGSLAEVLGKRRSVGTSTGGMKLVFVQQEANPIEIWERFFVDFEEITGTKVSAELRAEMLRKSETGEVKFCGTPALVAVPR